MMLGSTMDAKTYLQRLAAELDKLNTDHIQALADAIYQRYESERFVYIIGNGGSGANASHLCEDLGKSTVDDFETQKRLKVLSLTDNTPYILAWGNDTSFDRIFVEQLKNFGQAGDLLIAISGSGNSPNILRAVEWANEHSIETFGITGFSGGELKQSANQSIHCVLDDMGMVESLHLALFHYVLDDVYGRINGKKPAANVA